MIEFTWFDVIIGSFFALSIILGIYRGLIREMITIVIWGIAFILALVHGETAGELFTFVDSAHLKKIFGMVMIFVSVLIAGVIIKFFAFRSFNIGKPVGLDRLLGAIFGFFRAVIIVALVLTFVAPTKIADDDAYQDSQLIPQFQDLVDFLTVKLPPKWQHKKAEDTTKPSTDSGVAAPSTATNSVAPGATQDTEQGTVAPVENIKKQ